LPADIVDRGEELLGRIVTVMKRPSGVVI
jgi:hypothetical protein